MDEKNQVTMQENLSEVVYMYRDIMDNTDVTSDEHKEASKNYFRTMELILATDKQANDNNLAWAKHDLDVKKAEQTEAELKRAIKREIAKTTIDLLAIAVPTATTLIKQTRSQEFGDYQMGRIMEFETNGTLTTIGGKSAWKLIENETKG